MQDWVAVSGVRVRGPLAVHVRGFAEFLDGQGYAAGSVHCQLGLVAQLSGWLEAHELCVWELTELEAERFLAARRARVRRLFRSRDALEPVISYLRGVGAVPVPVPAGPLSPVDVVLARYERYLLMERSVTAATAKVYVRSVRPFLVGFEHDGQLGLERLTRGGCQRVYVGRDGAPREVDLFGRDGVAVVVGVFACRGCLGSIVDVRGARGGRVARRRVAAAA